MRFTLALRLSSPLLHVAHVEALLLLPRNQGVRRRFKELCRIYSLAHLNHSDPYAEDQDADDADKHPEVVAARRPILAIEAMLTDGRHQAALANYREAFLRGDNEQIERVEGNIAAMLELQPDPQADVPLHVVG